MRKRLEFIALYGISWVVLFQFFRIVFLAYHYKKTLELPSNLWVSSAAHGLQMDISFAGYILMIPAMLTMFTAKKWRWYGKTLSIYSAVVAFCIVSLVIADLELFKAWGFRIDGTFIQYLRTPVEAIASMGAAPVFPVLVLFAVLFFLVWKVLQTIVRRSVLAFEKTGFLYTIPVFLILTASLIIPIRGGLQLAPMNESAVFFSDKSFANYAAVNVPWNFMSSLLNATYSKKNPFIYFDKNQADQMVRSLYKADSISGRVVKDGKINVVVIIWESLTAKVVGSLNGVKHITPQFDQLTKEGMLFTNVYASGNRSDKGMVAILSGYPAQPTNSIIKIPKKTSSLPSLPKVFHKNGWYTSFYYGGETEFANMKSYFLQQDFDQIIDKNDFDEADMNSKWGAHDHIVLDRLLNDLDKQKQPFFSTLFTLSSHEPFEVPVKTVIEGNDSEHLFMNAHHYTDASIGDFIKKAKTKAWWDNTLVIIIADHGHPLPETNRTKPAEFHIPMLWLGGPLEKQSTRVDSLCSQTDLATTLLNQLHMPSGSFEWSNDIFGKNRVPFAYFTFNNGLGWMKPGGYLVRDNIGGNITEKAGALTPEEENFGKAYLQSSFSDYLNR
ncbi:LTA synthase family protein [Dyadobacter fanqingshengii]|uniref:Sulfatase-like hydrolase/transferase n=1 Tax=Dyadobacter fanqingshengii TaxID=2906443 RepID=A0A9X1T915_9BACT|nr:alkaline phosphatase family protein [Dyadobacter fanqingshengii]MCF0040730.1 sulfatase-like hydrolase/transferase [Dyadobacter fanqingshengii]USJ37534.1 sulfatase-like hydrolase/transferase [Dyadobacter fanqingshengii]